jgi:hypothetical protein
MRLCVVMGVSIDSSRYINQVRLGVVGPYVGIGCWVWLRDCHGHRPCLRSCRLFFGLGLESQNKDGHFAALCGAVLCLV